MNRILIVEDDPDIAELVNLHLQDMKVELTTVNSGTEAYTLILNRHYDLVILDIMLPGMDGLELCRHIRQQSKHSLILMLTAKSSELDRVLGLELGADDYLTKPFSVRELVARVKALFRRNDALLEGSTQKLPEDDIEVGELRVNLDKRLVSLRGHTVDLTAKEFDLLVYFAQHPGRVFSRAQLLDNVWGYGHDGYEHTVNSHINRLRGKIEDDPSQPVYILTVWGVGYKFTELSGSQKHNKPKSQAS